MKENLEKCLDGILEMYPYIPEENRIYFQNLKEGIVTPIPKQLAIDLKQREILEQAEKKAQQELNLLNRKANGLKESERKARTKRLIDRGALLESLVPCVKDLPMECLKTWLESAVFSQEARTVLEQILLESDTGMEAESEEEDEEAIDVWED